MKSIINPMTDTPSTPPPMDIYSAIAVLAEDYVDCQMQAFYSISFIEELRKRYPHLNDGMVEQ